MKLKLELVLIVGAVALIVDRYLDSKYKMYKNTLIKTHITTRKRPFSDLFFRRKEIRRKLLINFLQNDIPPTSDGILTDYQRITKD